MHSSSQRSTLAHKSSALRIEETELGKLFKFAPCGSGQLFALVAPDMVVPGVPSEVLQRSSLKPARPLCDGRSLVSPFFRRLEGRGAFFFFFWAVSPFDGFYTLRYLRLAAQPCMFPHTREIPFLNAAACVITCRASALPPSGFDRANLH